MRFFMFRALYFLYRDGRFYACFFTRDAAVAAANTCFRSFPESDWQLVAYI